MAVATDILDTVDLDEHVDKQIDDFRRQLLGLTLRNPLLSCPHGSSARAQIRIVHELHDAVFAHFDRGEAFDVVPLPEPRDAPDDEEDEEFEQALAQHKANSLAYELAITQLKQSSQDADLLEALEREARDLVRIEMGRGKWEPQQGLSPEELARRHGLDPSFDLSSLEGDGEIERYYDDALQTLLPEQDLTSRLRLLRERARSDLRDRGVHTLFAAFGFLEWYEDDTSQRPHLAPLVLVPVELDRVTRNSRRAYVLRQTGEEPIKNAALAVDLSRRFDLELPKLDPDDTPESYFKKLDPILDHQRRWRVRRFLTIQIFSDAKLAIYADLAADAWPEESALSRHGAVRQLMSKTGVVDAPYADDHDIDGDRAASRLPTLIYDADSSQHSAIVDALSGANVTIYGPPGTGKSQTITNLIAAALDAQKSVLFVAEKLTALDVVHKRLSEAQLDPYCLVLHSRGVRREAVREALRRRVDMAPPQFDETTYGVRKKSWETQRDALKLYASVMGDRLGALRLTVHETLWAEIRLRDRGENLPPSIATIRLPETKALALTANELQEIKRKLDDLASAYRTLGEPGGRPWRGIDGHELAPPELQPTLYRLAIWRDAIDNVTKMAGTLSGPAKAICHDRLAAAKHAMSLLASNVELKHDFDLAALARHDTRYAVIGAEEAATRATRDARALREKFDLDPTCLPQADEVRAIIGEAQALGCIQLTAEDLAAAARDDRRNADAAVRVRSALDRLYRIFDISEPDVGSPRVVLHAMERLGLTPRSLLLARTDSWVEERAHNALSGLQTSVEKVRHEREALEERFDLKSLPGAAELRTAGRRLETAGWLWWLSAASRRASRLHKGIALQRSRTGAGAAAVDLLRLADFADAVASLMADEDGNALFGAGWRGAETDLREALEVSRWAESVARGFSGVGAGRAEIRRTLLYGEIDLLDEAVNIAADLEDLDIADHAGEDGVSIADPEELFARARRVEELADRVRRTGLPQGLPLNGMEEIGDLIDLYRKNRGAASDPRVPRLGDDATADSGSLAGLAHLSRAIEEEGVAEEAWHDALKASADHGLGTPEEWIESVGAAVEEERRLWRAWADPLEVDETAFFDGLERKAASMETLRERAEECLSGGKTILDWCRYRRIRNEIFGSEARPVLLSFERGEVDIERLSVAFELTLYRTLASIVFREFPVLQQVTGEQLHNHRQAFKDIEEELQRLERLRIAHELYRRPVEPGISVGPPSALTNRALINQQLDLKRGSVSPRDLIDRAGTALRQLKPCFMMSPTTVAELLPKMAGLFDLVVIDEASQMLPADALGAIARARNAIIVGDPQQLPPTTFFQGGAVVSRGEDDDGLAAASESILDLAMSAWRPHRYLRWHYRSRHSALIQFSNATFYQDRMIVFPSPDEGRAASGVNLRYVEDGIYGGDRTNRVEAEKIVEAVLRFTSNRDNWEQSLAIVTMNQPQRDFLDEMLDKVASDNKSLASYIRRWDSTLEPFTVKNLESVQGDERDVIFISTVYGPQTPGGPVLQTFGPVTQQGGERRLNVLFTRARWRIDVFSSMRADDIQRRPGQSRGVQVLRDYLEYAATGRIATGVDTGRPTESPFEEHVKERLEVAGYDVTPQVGVASYRIDLGVKHTDYPHGFLLGIECDGATYHSAKSVRDRDRLRETVLRNLGWDIYRIWSTDWFNDPDREMRRLLDYLRERSEDLNVGEGRREPDLGGAVVDEEDGSEEAGVALDETITVAEGMTDEEDSHRDADVVEVGDSVYFRRNIAGSDVRKVVIVDGADDPDRGMINDTKPLARAVLGRSPGETVTIRQPNAHFEIVIERLVKDRPHDGAEASGPTQSELFGGSNGVEPYPIWHGTTQDPRTISTVELAETLKEIVETEGPIVTERIYRAYIRSSSLQRAGRQVRGALNKALGQLERRNIVTIARQGTDSGYAGAIVRLAGSPEIVLRDRGDRDFAEIPIDELAEMYRLIRSESPGEDEESIRRELLARYGLTRMTANVRHRLEEAARRR